MLRKRFMLRRVAHCSCCSEGGCCIQSWAWHKTALLKKSPFRSGDFFCLLLLLWGNGRKVSPLYITTKSGTCEGDRSRLMLCRYLHHVVKFTPVVSYPQHTLHGCPVQDENHECIFIDNSDYKSISMLFSADFYHYFLSCRPGSEAESTQLILFRSFYSLTNYWMVIQRRRLCMHELARTLDFTAAILALHLTHNS